MTSTSTPVAISQALAKFVAEAEFSHLSAEAVRQTRFALMDAIGVSLAATTLAEEVQPFLAWSKTQGTQGKSSLWAQNQTASAAMAAFANGALAHALDFEDAHDEALVHPNAAVVPAVLAAAQNLPTVNGEELITAIAVGCEITCRLGLAASSVMAEHSWYPPPILSAYGAAAAVAKLLQLKPEQILSAFSLCLLQATCSAELKHNPDSHIRAVRDAFPAQTGVVAAELASLGVQGFAAPFEGQDGFFASFTQGQYLVEPLLDNLGQRFEIARLSFKPWPSCRGTHIAIELALQLCSQHGLRWQDIKKICVTGHPLNRMLAEPIAEKQKPQNAINAKFSIPFCVASAVVDNDVHLGSFGEQQLIREPVLTVAEKVSYEVDDGYEHPLMGRISITTADGEQFRAEGNNALGCPARPLDENHIVTKFRQCLAHSQSHRHKTKSVDVTKFLLHLEQQNDLNPLFNFL